MQLRIVTTLALCLLFAVESPPPASGADGAVLSWTAPSGWLAEKPSNPARTAQYRIAGDAGDAECVAYSFQAEQGSEALTSAQIWAAQFTPADGRSGKEAMQVEKRTVGDIEVLVVTVSGTYQSVSIRESERQSPKPNHMLLGAVAMSPGANGLFKLTGPKATVEAQRSAFDALVASMKEGAGGSH